MSYGILEKLDELMNGGAIRQELFSCSRGIVSIVWPTGLSVEEANEVTSWLYDVGRKIRIASERAEAAKVKAAPPKPEPDDDPALNSKLADLPQRNVVLPPAGNVGIDPADIPDAPASAFPSDEKSYDSSAPF